MTITRWCRSADPAKPLGSKNTIVKLGSTDTQLLERWSLQTDYQQHAPLFEPMA